MNQQQLNDRIATMKAKLAQDRKRHSVELVEAKPETKRALAFARLAHAGQTRKYVGTPYIDHPIEVANILIKQGITDERTICVALLHDVVEDTPVPIEQIGVDFNHQIQRDVAALTKPTNHKNRAAKLAAATKNQIVSGPTAVLVKIADIMSNISDVALYDPSFASTYLEEKLETLREFSRSTAGKNPQVRKLLNAAYDVHGEAMNQLALTVLAEENERIANEAEISELVQMSVHQKQVEDLAEYALF